MLLLVFVVKLTDKKMLLYAVPVNFSKTSSINLISIKTFVQCKYWILYSCAYKNESEQKGREKLKATTKIKAFSPYLVYSIAWRCF